MFILLSPHNKIKIGTLNIRHIKNSIYYSPVLLFCFFGIFLCLNGKHLISLEHDFIPKKQKFAFLQKMPYNVIAHLTFEIFKC